RSAHKRAENRPRVLPWGYRDWCFSPDWRFILLSTNYKCEAQIALWEVATQAEQVLTWGGFKHLQFAADGKRFTHCGDAGENRHYIKRWDLADGAAPRLPLERQVIADAVAVSPDLETFVTAWRRPNDAAELFPESGQRFLPLSAFNATIPELSPVYFVQ